MKTCPQCAAPHKRPGRCCSPACSSAWVEARTDKARGFTDADVLRLIDDRLTSGAICAALDTHAKTVRRIARQNGRIVFDPATNWTDDMLATAKEMRASGATFASIGAHLGMKKSAVTNRFRRDRIKSSDPAPAKKDSAPETANRVRRPIAPPMPQVPTPIPRLVRDGCMWPIGEGRSLRYCGAPEVLGKPYCEACCRRAYPNWGVAA